MKKYRKIRDKYIQILLKIKKQELGCIPKLAKHRSQIALSTYDGYVMIYDLNNLENEKPKLKYSLKLSEVFF